MFINPKYVMIKKIDSYDVTCFEITRKVSSIHPCVSNRMIALATQLTLISWLVTKSVVNRIFFFFYKFKNIFRQNLTCLPLIASWENAIVHHCFHQKESVAVSQRFWKEEDKVWNSIYKQCWGLDQVEHRFWHF